jgi:triacylglycerol lipase
MDPVLQVLGQRPSGQWRWDFERAATTRSAVSAVALCNLSILAYSTRATVERYLRDWGGFTAPTHLLGPSTQGFVTSREGAIFITFRGTEPLYLRDWHSDLDYSRRPLLLDAPPQRKVPGLVHGGFASGVEEVMPQLLPALSKLDAGSMARVFVTGHSLGGALAVIAAAVLHFAQRVPIAGVYTYGQPRAGDSAFSGAYDKALGPVTYRYVNDLDIVPHVPPERLPWAPRLRLSRSVHSLVKLRPRDVVRELRAAVMGETFKHVGQVCLLLRDGTLTSDESEWQKREVIYSGTVATLLSHLPDLIQFQLSRTITEDRRILDHDPVNGYLPKLEAQLNPSPAKPHGRSP